MRSVVFYISMHSGSTLLAIGNSHGAIYLKFGIRT